MKRFSAKLLFQYRVTVNGDSGRRRTCEERILVIDAPSAKQALARAKRRGKEAEFDFENDQGNPVRFEFLGVMDLLELGSECDPDEVWYNIVERLLPSERRSALIPPEEELSVFRSAERRGKIRN